MPEHDEPSVRGHSVEILALLPGECEGDPVAMFTVRINPESQLRSATLMLSQKQAVFVRNVLDRYLTTETCWLYLSKERQRGDDVAIPDDDDTDDDLTEELLADDDLPEEDEQ